MAIEVKTVLITELGAQGDGCARHNDRTIFVPGALPGEMAKIRIAGETAELCELESRSPDRVTPICRHFEQCGGCRTQHISAARAAEWKQAIVREAFHHRGLDVDVAPVRTVELHARRRAVLAARNDHGAIKLGYREAASHTIVDLSECPVLDDAIVAAFQSLKTLAALILSPGDSARLYILRTDDGLDVATGKPAKPLDARTREAISTLAGSAGLVRLRIDNEPIYQQRTPTVSIEGIPVEVSADTFLQAVPEAEQILASLVRESIGKAKRVADLFSGVGTFAFGMARTARVLAVDSDRKAIAALDKAARAATGLKPIETRVRDLLTEPLSRLELEGYDAVVFDPPRAGARAQAEAIARSSVPLAIAISCNPATLARDCRILVDAGFNIESIVPVDQFRFSPHIEAVAIMRRKPQQKSPRRRLI